MTDEGYQIHLIEAYGITINDSSQENRWNLYISLPVSDPSRPYFKTWYLVDSGFLAANIGAAAAFLLTTEDKMMPSGWRTFSGASHLLKAILFVPAMGEVSVEQIWPIELDPVIPVIFPVLDLTIIYGTDGELLFDGTDWFFMPVFSVVPFTYTLPTFFQVSLSFKPVQSGSSTPSADSWEPERIQGSAGNFEDLYYAAPGPGGDFLNDNLIKDGAPPPYTMPVDPHLPVRIRLKDIASGTYGPYQYWARPIIFA